MFGLPLKIVNTSFKAKVGATFESFLKVGGKTGKGKQSKNGTIFTSLYKTIIFGDQL